MFRNEKSVFQGEGEDKAAEGIIILGFVDFRQNFCSQVDSLLILFYCDQFCYQ